MMLPNVKYCQELANPGWLVWVERDGFPYGPKFVAATEEDRIARALPFWEEEEEEEEEESGL